MKQCFKTLKWVVKECFETLKQEGIRWCDYGGGNIREYKNGVKIYDENMPRHIMNGKECYWWKETIGKVIKVEYMGIIRHIKFIKYETRYITYLVIETNQIFTSCINVFICHGGILNNAFPEYKKMNVKWKYNIGDVIETDIRELVVIDKEMRTRIKHYNVQEDLKVNEKFYRVKCLTCGYDDNWIREDLIPKSLGCPCCSGHILVPGINDVATQFPQYVKLFTNPQEAKEHTRGEHVWVNTTCPCCGYQKDMYLINICLGKYSCDICSDKKISYAEKFFMNLLDQLGIEYTYQYRKIHADWCDKYIYDIYIKKYDYIVELHGNQHYVDVESWCSNFENVQLNDKNKEELAIKNVKEYIVVDCRYSEPEYIIYNLKNSILKKIINFEGVDFEQCNEFARKPYVESIIKLWRDGHCTAEIADIMGLSINTVRKKLHYYMSVDVIDDYTQGECQRRKRKYDETRKGEINE